MVKTDLKRKIHMNQKETHIADHIATWHQQTFNFNEVKHFFGELWQDLLITVWLHSKEAKSTRTQKKMPVYVADV